MKIRHLLLNVRKVGRDVSLYFSYGRTPRSPFAFRTLRRVPRKNYRFYKLIAHNSMRCAVISDGSYAIAKAGATHFLLPPYQFRNRRVLFPMHNATCNLPCILEAITYVISKPGNCLLNLIKGS